MEGIKITKRPRLKSPYMLVAWPGMGEVAFKAASYLVEKLKAEEFAEISPADFFYFTGVSVQEGILNLPELPHSKFYFWKKPVDKNNPKAPRRDLIIFLSNAQPDLIKAEEYSKKILHVAKAFGVKTVIGSAAMPAPIEHTQAPRVWFTTTSAELNSVFKKHDLNLLSQGQVSGMNGLLLGMAKKEGLSGVCLLGEIPLYAIQIDNPRAVHAVLKVLSTILDVQIDYSGIIEQARIMDEEINKLLDFLKGGPQVDSPIGEEEIEKIRHSLGQLTKLPLSVKEKIDKLFEQARTDILKAGELKLELDRWSVYKEYEDRFLDLFKKGKDKGN